MNDQDISGLQTSGPALDGVPAVRLAVLMALAGAGAAAQAQSWFVQPVITTMVTATNNSGFDSGGTAQNDVILNVAPGVIVRGNGPRLKVDGEFYVAAVDYLNSTQSNTLLPRGSLRAEGTVVERLLFVDAGVSAFQTSQTPYGARPEGASSFNTETTTQYSVRPAIRHDFDASTRLEAYANNTWLRTSHASASLVNPRDNAYVQDQYLSLERQPRPLGAELRLGRQNTNYAGASNVALTMTNARGVLSYSFLQELSIGAIGGYERDEAPYAKASDQIYGLQTKWAPDERTRLDATVEHRFFGTGWDAVFSHRTPWQAWNLRLVRQASTYASSLASLAAGGNIGQLLDATFTTRYPDPVERARVVNEFIASRGLPTTLNGPIDIYTNSAQLEQRASLTYLITGPRDTLACAYYAERISPLAFGNATDPSQLLVTQDSAQQGFSIQYNHRLTPLVSLDTLASWSRLEGRGASEGTNARDSIYRAGLNWQLAQHSTGTFGLRWRQHHSTVTPDADETALYVGLDHRF